MKWSEIAQSCPTLGDPVDCSLPGSSIHGIFQARVLEWVAISFSRGSSRAQNGTWVSCIADRCFTLWATREASLDVTNFRRDLSLGQGLGNLSRRAARLRTWQAVKKKKRKLLKVCDIFGDELPFPEYCQDLTHHLPLTLGVLSSTEDWPDQSSPAKVEH